MVLLDPSESFVEMDGGIVWRGFKTFVFFPSRQKYIHSFDWIGGGYSDPNMDKGAEHLYDVIEFGSARINKVPQGIFFIGATGKHLDTRSSARRL